MCVCVYVIKEFYIFRIFQNKKLFHDLASIVENREKKL